VDAERALKPDRSKSFRECLNDADKDICPEMIVRSTPAIHDGIARRR
jgi:hypothetical protein